MKKRFEKLLGNEYTARRLSDAIISKTLPHALLIVGPRGSGKHTLATEIAAAANCEQIDTDMIPLPCGRCNRCKRIYEGNFPDVSTLGRIGGKATIGVEELRDYREDMFLSSTESAYKFYIIEDADTMTPAAQNALLKVLEEPPNNVHILLLAKEADKILSTIKSRTQYVQMEIFEFDKLKKHVTELSDSAAALGRTDPQRQKEILLAAGGIIGEALECFDEKKLADIEAERKIINDFIEALPKRAPFSKLLKATSNMPQKREELKSLLENIRQALRDMIAYRVSESIAPLYFLSSADIETAVGSIGTKRLISIFDIITEALSDLEKNVTVNPLLTDLAVKIKDA